MVWVVVSVRYVNTPFILSNINSFVRGLFITALSFFSQDVITIYNTIKDRPKSANTALTAYKYDIAIKYRNAHPHTLTTPPPPRGATICDLGRSSIVQCT